MNNVRSIIGVFAVCALVGCGSEPNPTPQVGDPNAPQPPGGSIQRSNDNGRTFDTIAKINGLEGTPLFDVDVLTAVFDYQNPDTIYVGLSQAGGEPETSILRSTNGGDSWESVGFPPNKAYGIAANGDTILATGVWQGRSKVFRTQNGGENWDEVYTEPTSETVIIAMKMNPQNPDEIFVSTSDGVIFKTENGGDSWSNVYNADEPVIEIYFDAQNQNTLYARLFEEGEFLRSLNGGETFEEMEVEVVNVFIEESTSIVTGEARVRERTERITPDEIYSMQPDPNAAGVLYVGTEEGLFRSGDFGVTWEQVEIIGSALGIPISAIAVSPHRSGEVIYNAGQVVYTSYDGAVRWSTFQQSENSRVNKILYDPEEPSIVYIFLRRQG